MDYRTNWNLLTAINNIGVVDQLRELLQNLLFMFGYCTGKLAEKSATLSELIEIWVQGVYYGMQEKNRKAVV